MARRKIRLAYITNESRRKASYKKRKKGLLKKLHELTVLCNVEACVIMYSSFDLEPVVWPSVEGMEQTIARFRSLPNVEQTRRMLNQETFVQERIQKLNTHLIKLKKESREKEMTALLYRILAGEHIASLSVEDLNDLGWVINLHLSEINSRIEAIMKEASTSASTSTPALAPFLAAAPAPSLTIASTSVLRQPFPQDLTSLNSGTSNLVVPDMFTMQNYGGNVNTPSPMLPMPNFHPGMAWDYESWAHFINMMNNNNKNDPTQGGPSSSRNP